MLPREYPHSFTPILIQMRRGRTVVEQVHERTPSRHTHELVRISDIIRLLGLRRIQRIVFLNHFRRSHGLARIRGGYAGYRV